MRNIAKKHGVWPYTVVDINKRYQIRRPEFAKKIGYEIRSQNRTRVIRGQVVSQHLNSEIYRYLKNTNLSMNEIAERLGVWPTTVADLNKKYKIRSQEEARKIGYGRVAQKGRAKVAPKLKEAIFKMKRLGATRQHIKNATGLSEKVIVQVLRQEGKIIPGVVQKYSDFSEDKKIVEKYIHIKILSRQERRALMFRFGLEEFGAQPKMFKDIAKRMGISRRTAGNYVRKGLQKIKSIAT